MISPQRFARQFFTAVLTFVALAPSALAQFPIGTGNTATGTPIGTGNPGSSGEGTTLVNPLKAESLDELLRLVLEAAVSLGTIILVLALVWVGFLFVAARGNEEKLRSAKTALFWTVIGGLILLGAQGISTVIQSTATNLGS